MKVAVASGVWERVEMAEDVRERGGTRPSVGVDGRLGVGDAIDVVSVNRDVVLVDSRVVLASIDKLGVSSERVGGRVAEKEVVRVEVATNESEVDRSALKVNGSDTVAVDGTVLDEVRVSESLWWLTVIVGGKVNVTVITNDWDPVDVEVDPNVLVAGMVVLAVADIGVGLREAVKVGVDGRLLVRV